MGKIGAERETANIMHPKVDPAALLVAVLAVGISPLLTVGAWDLMNTVVAVVVMVVVVAFTWPRIGNLRTETGPVRRRTPVDDWGIAAQAVVYGFIVAIGVAWPVQQLVYHPENCDPQAATEIPDSCHQRVEQVAGWASYWALGIGLVVAVGLFIWVRIATKRLLLSVPAGTA